MKRNKALALMIFAGILWGITGIFVNVLSEYGFSSIQLNCVRAIISALTFGAITFFKDKKLFRATLKQLLLSFAVGTCMFTTALCYFNAISMTGISVACVLMNTSPIFVVLYSVFFLGEGLSMRKGCAVAAIMVGVIFVSGAFGGDATFNLTGCLVGMVSGISYATYTVLTKKAMMLDIDPMTLMFYGFLFQAVVSLFISEPFKIAGYVKAAPLKIIPLLLCMAVVACVIPYLFCTVSLKSLPAGIVSSMGVIEPLTSAVVGIAIFGEPFTAYTAVGIVLILASIVVIGIESGREKS